MPPQPIFQAQNPPQGPISTIPRLSQERRQIAIAPIQPPQHVILSNPSSTHSSPHPARAQNIHIVPQNNQVIPVVQAPVPPQDIMQNPHFQHIYNNIMQQNANLQHQLHQMDAKYNAIANRLIGEVNTNKIKLKNEEIERRIQSQNYERQRSVDEVKRMKDRQFEENRERRVENLERKIKGLESELKVKSEINKIMKLRGAQAENNGQDLVNENVKLKAQIQTLKNEKNEFWGKMMKRRKNYLML